VCCSQLVVRPVPRAGARSLVSPQRGRVWSSCEGSIHRRLFATGSSNSGTKEPYEAEQPVATKVAAGASQEASAADGPASASASADSPPASEESSADASPVARIPDVPDDRTLLAVPHAWKDAGQWVDLEFERAGLPTDGGSETLESPWGGKDHPQPESNVLWPHSVLADHRSRPFDAPVGVKAGQQTRERLAETRTRLSALWKMSSSHGVSWDELDEAYVRFARSGKARYDQWAGPEGEAARRETKVSAEKAVGRFVPASETGQKMSVWEVFPSRVKRVQGRMYSRRKKEWLGPWRPGQLTIHLQQLVAARMARRESAERLLDFQSSLATKKKRKN